MLTVTSEETTLVNYLLTNYDKHVKPTLKATSPVYVAVGFGLSQIQGLVSWMFSYIKCILTFKHFTCCN